MVLSGLTILSLLGNNCSILPKFSILELPVKSDWLGIQKECSAHAQKIGSGQRSGSWC